MGGNAIGSAIAAALAPIEGNGIQGHRRVIDISADGDERLALAVRRELLLEITGRTPAGPDLAAGWAAPLVYGLLIRSARQPRQKVQPWRAARTAS
jgi:hypothetical protein